MYWARASVVEYGLVFADFTSSIIFATSFGLIVTAFDAFTMEIGYNMHK